MKEKGTWNAPTAEEKIIALEAKLDSTVKSLNKKVSFERKKGGGGKKHADAKGSGKKDGESKKDGDHPKKWPTPKTGDKKEAMFKGHMWYWCGGQGDRWKMREMACTQTKCSTSNYSTVHYSTLLHNSKLVQYSTSKTSTMVSNTSTPRNSLPYVIMTLSYCQNTWIPAM